MIRKEWQHLRRDWLGLTTCLLSVSTIAAPSMLPVAILLLVGLLTATGLVRERTPGRLELLSMSGLAPWQLLLAKLVVPATVGLGFLALGLTFRALPLQTVLLLPAGIGLGMLTSSLGRSRGLSLLLLLGLGLAQVLLMAPNQLPLLGQYLAYLLPLAYISPGPAMALLLLIYNLALLSLGLLRLRLHWLREVVW